MALAHLTLTKKNGERMIVHHDILKQAFPANKENLTIAVLKIPFHDSDLTFVTIRESVESVGNMLDEIERKLEKVVNNNEG